MTTEQVVFAVAGAVCCVAATNAVLRREPLTSALSLLLTLFALAVIYLSLGAQFLFGVQIAVYAGAIMALLIIVIMLLDAGGKPAPTIAGGPRLSLAGPILSLALFAGLALAIVRGHVPVGVEAPTGQDHVQLLADVLFVRFLLPFEIVSVLLLAALIAAVVIVKKRSTEREWPGR